MKKIIFYLIGIIFLMVSCYPGDIESYDETDIVFTNYTESFDFGTAGTYAIPDQIVKITGNLADGDTPVFVSEPYNSEILNQIESDMAALGWTKVDTPEDADLVMMPAVWTNTTIVYWYDYWCWYYYYYCGWGWYYPYYTSYTTGTLVMSLISKDPQFTEPSSVWTGAINGLMSGSYSLSRITKGIDQAFTQSPYLDIK